MTKHIICRFGLPQTIKIDQDTKFIAAEAIEFASEHEIQMLNSSPYYAQANGQTEPTNKTLKLILKNTIERNPRHWNELLQEVLWAYRTSKETST